MIEQLRDKAIELCKEHGITAKPYAGGWWLVSNNINRVIEELARLSPADLTPLPIMERKQTAGEIRLFCVTLPTVTNQMVN